ncbi:MAG: 2-dehydro-3-deoxygalactonokinase [Synergistetes bacterium]|nr:MAG: 2-dehydro-3-deoxygalactonokinase [bacterium 42_11]MBC7331068.1 2-dehydro-3-deoxygalactonokinase [Synergistota bacterium]MDK2871824.1 2-dehydro-3-deoxygalactonokinase [bacterium]
MKKGFLICIDGGTTNTRVRLIRLSDFSIVAKTAESIGAKDTKLKGREALEEALSTAIQRIFRENQISKEEIAGVTASGMITSEAGLLEVPHVIAPAGIDEIASGVIEETFEKIWPDPILFIPGVKTLSNKETPSLIERINSQDIMRGEECESLGIIKLEKISGPGIILLPGSHTKFVFINEENRIEGSLTTLAGELANAVISSTLIGRSVEDLDLPLIEEKYLLEGFKMAQKYGLTRSLFTIRLLHIMGEGTPLQRKCFLWGAIVGTDIMAFEESENLKKMAKSGEIVNLFVGGKSPLKEIFGTLIDVWAQEKFPKIRVKILSSETTERSSAVGASLVALKRIKLN